MRSWILRLSDQSANEAFRNLLAGCEETEEAALVVGVWVFAAIEQLLGDGKVHIRIKDERVGPITLKANDAEFRVTLLRPTPRDRMDWSVPHQRFLYWLVPTEMEEAARQVINADKMRNKVSVMSIETYLSLRLLFSSLDESVSMEDAAKALIERFHQCQNRIAPGRGIRVSLA